MKKNFKENNRQSMDVSFLELFHPNTAIDY